MPLQCLEPTSLTTPIVGCGWRKTKKARGLWTSRLVLKLWALVAPAVTCVAATFAAAETVTALFLGPSFINRDVAVAQLAAVQAVDSFLRFFGGTHSDKAETTGTAIGAVDHQV